MDTKKGLIVLILRMLETATDEREPLTQVKMAELISRKYPCDRKTVGRNIRFLRELGFPIVRCARGFYMDRKLFTREEIALVLSAVRGLGEGQLAAPAREELCDRLYTSLSRYYKI